MELTSNQVAALNSKLPAGYKIEPVSRKEPRPVGSSQRRTEADNLDFDVEFASRLPEKRSTREKRKPSGFEESEAKPRQGDAVRKIQKILQILKKNPYAEPFLQPVDVAALPDYLQVVSEPMDLSTVEEKLKNGDYETAYQFAMDVRKIWSNSFRYNAKGSELYSMTMEISDQFEKLIEGNEQLILSDKKDALHDLYRKVEKMSKEIKDLHARGANKPIQKTFNEKPMTLQEKRVLGQNIRKLDPKHLRGVLDIVRDSMSLDADGGELVIDLDTLPPRVCRELETYVKNLQQNTLRTSKKRKPGEINFPGIMSAQQNTTKRLKEIDSQLEEIAISKPKQEETGPKLESESESSSSDDSDLDDEVVAPMARDSSDNLAGFSVSSMWNSFQQERMQHSTEESYGSMLDKSHEMFNYPS
mmetsp:Transcript_18375/g.33018  ORF Transcript_18375/g.33018 Transcript_18375/m.33018 type:complete len:416 (-) Transcript_18375:832-2079(-)|eukprot:CAMPEP_0204918404 /NCGR_PEP_ID=MMETSP1397-20131031/16122_1 /ASSEMBLY_ACC=CAM_ASM_000891 /TAXON_ID=49980 /ORGANISM="Climacostomum Climacostomum virens, Strain Stock W-24" /LENGTH=415 /DNA_ID=CAMNT_0052091685 /DNA_START=538 /DNA_END=1785 /DNA_ORIENTATION=-